MILSSAALSTWRFPSIFVTGIVPRWIRCSIALGERPIYSAASARSKEPLHREYRSRVRLSQGVGEFRNELLVKHCRNPMGGTLLCDLILIHILLLK